MRQGRRGALLVLAVLVAACAPRAHPRIPEGEAYLYPDPAPEARPEEARRIQAAWRDVLAGKTGAAEKAFSRLLAGHPVLTAARTGLGYAKLRADRLDEAARIFDQVLAARPDYAPALAGAGAAAARRGDVDAAVGFYRRTLDLRPGESGLRTRLAQVKLQATERHVAAARAAADQQQDEAAIAEYRRALAAAPELGGLRVEAADLLIRRGDAQLAIDLLKEDPADDRQVLLRLGELYSSRQDYGQALETYRRLLARDPKDAEALGRVSQARRAFELQQMPEEYRRIFSAPRVTRADLAALIVAKVTALGRVTHADPKVAVDVSGSWARESILRVLALDIMDVYPNHTFQPGAVARRGDLARAVARVLDLLQWPARPGPVPKDMSPNNLFRDAAVRVVSAGLMDTTPDGAFEPWRPISGADAAAVIEALARLLGP